MNHRFKTIGCLVLCVMLLLSGSGMAFAAGTPQEGVYTLTTDKGGSRGAVDETATLRVDSQGAMTLEVLIKDTMADIKLDGTALQAGEKVTRDGVSYIPYQIPLKEKTDSLSLTAYVAAMKRDVGFAVGLSGWDKVPGMDTAAGEAVAAGTHKITVANASTSAYGATTVYPEASLLVKDDGSCTITIYLKNSLANIRTADGTPVAAGEAKTLTVNGEEGTYYPYAFPIEMRQATLTVMDDVPAMSHVASMNNGKDMTTTINVDWNSAQGLEIKKLDNGDYTVPVAFQTASSMLTINPSAALKAADGKYALTVSFTAGVISALTYGSEQAAEKSTRAGADYFVINLDEEAGQIPVKLTVAKMQGTPMAVQSFVIVPDWTKAEKVEVTPVAGDKVAFVKADGSEFGMFTAQDGTTAVLDGSKVVIHYVPKNTTVYNAIHWGVISDETLTKDVVFNADGSFDILLDKDKCGTLIPVAPIKVKDGKTTSDQYYLSVPAEDKLEKVSSTVVFSSQTLKVNGVAQDVDIYIIDGSSYFKLRDIAAKVSGTGSQFDVAYDAAVRTVRITTGAAYTVEPDDLVTGVDHSKEAVRGTQRIEIDGQPVALHPYNIGGNNFFPLVELGKLLNFDVDYDAVGRAMLVTTK